MKVLLHESKQYSVEVSPASKNRCKYIFYEREKTIKTLTDSKQPNELTLNTNVCKQIKSCIDPDEELNTKTIKSNVDKILNILQENYETLILAEQQIMEEQKQNSESELNKLLLKAEKKLRSLDHPILWIGSNIEWLTAGERNNILLCFLAYCSQIILRNPISVIALGEAGSGKTHIEEVAMSLIPPEFIVNEKNITQAALFRRAEESIHYYDGKIVNYGDMGGSNDHEFMEESKNIMKELQSDGYVCKPVATKVEGGGWEVAELELIGKPCLTYTTVPNHIFDEQELSRSLLITPRTDNKKEFNTRNLALEFKGKTYQNMQHVVNECKIIKHMVYHLRLKMEHTEIINPYVNVVINYLNNSQYFKRDFPKFNTLLKVITALNYYQKEVHNDGEKDIIYTSAEDVQLFLSLLDKYHSSITHNLSLGAANILSDLNRLAHAPDDNGQMPLDEEWKFTVNEYLEKKTVNLSKRSIQSYISELNKGGFIRVESNNGNAPVYELTGKFTKLEIKQTLKIDKHTKEMIKEELGEDVWDFVKKDKIVEGLSIMDHDDSVLKPKW